MPLLQRATALAGIVLFFGCGAPVALHPSTPADVQAASPLGPSYVLMPLPNDDESLLGRVLLAPPDNGQSLDQISRPSECADKLTPTNTSPLASTFEDSKELAIGGKARAALAAFGFEGDASEATQFFYKLNTEKRVARTDTMEYVACCRDKGGCGYGFISALIYGDGEYATVAESNGEGSIAVPMAGAAGGYVKAKILHKRKVHGFVAALVTMTDPSNGAANLGPLGVAAAAGITETTLPVTVKAVYDGARLTVDDVKSETNFLIKDGHGAPITENEFARRFSSVTGSDELDAHNHARNKVALWGSGALFVGSVALLTLGIWALATLPTETPQYAASHRGTACAGYPKDDPNSGCSGYDGKYAFGFAGSLLGTFATIGNGFFFGYELFSNESEGSKEGDHDLSASESRLYVERYNRGLLRKTIRDAQGIYQRGAQITPVISPAFMGIAGRF